MAKKTTEILIIGRPNVGKSTIINRLTRSNKAITHDMPGVTRDLVSYPCIHGEKEFLITDSGGILLGKINDITMQSNIEALVKKGIERADKIIFIVDGREGLNPLDKVIANYLRPYQEKVVVAANKLDNPKTLFQSSSFYKLGLGEPFAVSATQGHGFDDMMTHLLKDIQAAGKSVLTMHQRAFRIAIVGRPNVGKSSLVNAIINDERILVDDVAGTTRDAIEVYFNHGENQYVFVDTAGLRKKARVTESVEFYSTVRSQKSIDNADLVVVILDSIEFLNVQDKKIINLVLDAKKPMIIFVNKWDLTVKSDQARKDLEIILIDELPFLENYPIIFGSAKTKHNIGKLFQTIPDIIMTATKRISTSEVNQFFKKLFDKTPPPAQGGKRLRIYYSTQVESSPPTFILFINTPRLVTPDYKRYLEKKLREYFGGFTGCPVQLFFKGKTQQIKTDEEVGILG